MYCSRFHCADWGYLPWQYDSTWVSLNECIPDAYQCRKRAFERPCWVWNFLHLWLLFLQVWLLVLHLALCSLDTVRFVRFVGCWLEESEEANDVWTKLVSIIAEAQCSRMSSTIKSFLWRLRCECFSTEEQPFNCGNAWWCWFLWIKINWHGTSCCATSLRDVNENSTCCTWRFAKVREL